MAKTGGGTWKPLGGGGNTNISVSSVSVTGPSSVTSGTPAQMSATVLPANATNKTLTWSVQNGTGTASIGASTGVLTGGSAGTVTVTARSTDGSSISSAAYTVTVTSSSTQGPGPDLTVGSNTYKTYTYTYPNQTSATWMVTNSREGSSSATYYSTNSNNVNGFYYTHGQASGACPTGWHLPSEAELTLQKNWINSNKTSEGAKFWLTDGGNAFAGYRANNSSWSGWGSWGWGRML